MRLPIVAMCGILVLAGCGASEQPVAESITSTTTGTTETITTTITTTESDTTETSEEEPTDTTEQTTDDEDYGEPEEYEEEADEEEYGEDEYATDWADYLPGVWVASLPYAAPAEELGTFNGNTGGALFQLWPRGVGISNPLDNGVALPHSSGYIYSVDGDTLTVQNVLSTRVYDNLEPAGEDCFTADYGGYPVEFCRY